MNDNTPIHTETAHARLRRLERSNTRWRMLAVALGAGGIGLVAGGMAQPRELQADDYRYVATDDTIYRIDPQGRFEYIKFENGVRSTLGYFDWGRVRIDPERRYSPRPQP